MSIKFLSNYQKNYYTEDFPVGPGQKTLSKKGTDYPIRLNYRRLYLLGRLQRYDRIDRNHYPCRINDTEKK